MDFNLFIRIANIIGIIAFASSGVFKSMKYNLDIFGSIILAIITSIGGGIIRDVLLNKIPSSFINKQDLYIALITAFIIYIFSNIIKFNQSSKKEIIKIFRRLVLYSDAIGLGIFTIIGASIAVKYNMGVLPTAIFATLTGVGGGVIRDMMVQEIPFILKEDIYASLSILGGMTYYLFINILHMHRIPSTIIIFTGIVVVRILVIRYRINLPKLYNTEE